MSNRENFEDLLIGPVERFDQRDDMFKGWLHDLVRSVIKRTPQLNPLILRMGDLLQHGKQRAPSTVWEDGHA